VTFECQTAGIYIRRWCKSLGSASAITFQRINLWIGSPVRIAMGLPSKKVVWACLALLCVVELGLAARNEQQVPPTSRNAGDSSKSEGGYGCDLHCEHMISPHACLHPAVVRQVILQGLSCQMVRMGSVL